MTLTIAVIGSIMVDVTLQAPRLPHTGENLYVGEAIVGTGGKGANAAVALARHDANVYLIGNVGADTFGDQACRELNQAGVKTSSIARRKPFPTGLVVMVAEDNGQTTYLAHTGANHSLTAHDVRDRLAPLLPELDALLFNFEPPEETLQAAVDLARQRNIPFFVDAAPERPYSASLWSAAALLSPNEPEAAFLTGRPITGDASALAAAQTLQAQGPPAVVLKRGASGALWATARNWGLVPAFSIPVVDPAGCGDAFTAGLVWATLSGQPLPDAIRWASACGALVAGRLGTLSTMPTRAEVEAFLRQQPPPAS